MIIVDAIKSAESEHAVFFLVTAYLESLRHFNETSRIPDYVLRLPIRGERDLRERVVRIDSASEVLAQATVPINEASAVFRSALERLSPIHSSLEKR